MSLIIEPLTFFDIEELKKKQKKNNKNNFSFSIVLGFLFLLNLFLFRGFIPNNIHRFIKITTLLLFGLILLKSLYESNYSLDLKEKNKYVGFLKVKKKILIDGDEGQRHRYKIEFDDWRIRSIEFYKKNWDLTQENDVFYVELTTNSEYILKLKRNNEDFIKGIIRI